MTTERSSPTGPASSLKETCTVPAIAIAASATATGTTSFVGVTPNNVIAMSPQAALGTGIAFSHARCTVAGTIEVTLANVTTNAVTAIAATYDCEVNLL